MAKGRDREEKRLPAACAAAHTEGMGKAMAEKMRSFLEELKRAFGFVYSPSVTETAEESEEYED